MNLIMSCWNTIKMLVVEIVAKVVHYISNSRQILHFYIEAKKKKKNTVTGKLYCICIGYY